MKTVVKAADDRSPRWKHTMILGGLLVGFEAQGRNGLSPDLRRLLESAVVTATNLALEDEQNQSELALHTVCLVVGHTFDLLHEVEKRRIDHNRLLPLLTKAIYFSRNGLQWGYFLGTMDADIVQDSNKFNWSAKSTTFFQVKKIATAPLMTILGSLSRVTAFCAESVSDTNLYFKLVEDVSAFTRTLCVQWQQNKLSEVDVSEETIFLHDEALNTTLPMLWQLLKSTLFSVIIAQTALFSRLLGDRSIPQVQHPFVAIQTLHTLRNLYFISMRLGHNTFSQQAFVYTTSIDILWRHPIQAEAFLKEIRPRELGKIPEHPHLRCLDLFFLNTAEYFASDLPPFVNEDLLMAAATPYTNARTDSRLIELFEAAHSVTLAIFSSPHNHALTTKFLPQYVDTVFRVFPQNLSPRQFRLAIKTLIRITSPPFAISETQPLFPSILLELVRTRSETASRDIIPPLAHQPGVDAETPLSEQAVMVLALIDSLTVLPFYTLDEWLPLTAEALNNIQDRNLLDLCRHRFWEVLSNGEMDVARAESCLNWWNTGGGRHAVLKEAPIAQKGPFMSGALPPQESKL